MCPGVAAVDAGKVTLWVFISHHLDELCRCALYAWSLVLPRRGLLVTRAKPCWHESKRTIS